MLLNDLPDDCLLTLFYRVDNFDELINFSKVCSRWNQLISYRLKSVKFALGSGESDFPQSTVYMNRNTHISDIETKLPNLKILNLIGPHEQSYFRKYVQNNKSIIGLIANDTFRDHFLSCRFQNLEIIVTDRLTAYLKNHETAKRLKQIHFKCGLNVTSFGTLLRENFHNLENLERLHIDDRKWATRPYSGPRLPNLKILEMTAFEYDDRVHIFPGFQFMDFCPSLQSAYFHFPFRAHPLEGSFRNANLRDLVFDCGSSFLTPQWQEIRAVIIRFPNLVHLAIRGNLNISYANLKELVNILTKVKLFDSRRTSDATSSSANFLRRYCTRSGRPIIIYYNCEGNEPEDWPKIIENDDQIVQGFDFMAHCFFRRYKDLPKILYPGD